MVVFSLFLFLIWYVDMEHESQTYGENLCNGEAFVEYEMSVIICARYGIWGQKMAKILANFMTNYCILVDIGRTSDIIAGTVLKKLLLQS